MFRIRNAAIVVAVGTVAAWLYGKKSDNTLKLEEAGGLAMLLGAGAVSAMAPGLAGLSTSVAVPLYMIDDDVDMEAISVLGGVTLASWGLTKVLNRIWH